jgi:F0F1-type ATP synthase assembly protein I
MEMDADESEEREGAVFSPVEDRKAEKLADDLSPFDPDPPQEEPFIIHDKPYEPESAAENVRRSGLAWSAGIVLFTSIAFTLFLGWIADLLLGSSPWGLVGGIILGSVIGFVQFFRISSQIFVSSDSKASPQTLFDERIGTLSGH